MASRRIKVWDWPVRVTHWSFAVLVPAMWLIAENSLWGWHTTLGVVLLGLLVFRLLWGFLGTRTARFTDFVRGPGRLTAYLRGGDSEAVGHSPLAALSVLALLGAMSAQVGMGLFAGDPFDGASGPLNPLVGVTTADRLTEWHETFYLVVLGLAALHIAAIAYYTFIRRDRLVGPMVTGRREVDHAKEGTGSVSTLGLLVAVIVAVGIAFWVEWGAPPLGG
ncbi:MAG: cytochrome b/b6 domain-containing protein [Erythrobacter sp.]